MKSIKEEANETQDKYHCEVERSKECPIHGVQEKSHLFTLGSILESQ